MTVQTTHQQATAPIIGSRVTYHGSQLDLRGRTFLLLPDTGCVLCDSEDEGVIRYTLADPATGDALKHVRPGSFTTIDDNWWPEDAITIDIAGYEYKAAFAAPGGSRWARIVHCHTATGELHRVWCRFDGDPTPAVRALDARRVI